MRSPALGSGLLAVVLAAGLTGTATADPSDPSGPGAPSVGEVREARERVDTARSEAEVLQDRIAAANAELDLASVRAARAAEAWNGARWAVQRAREAERTATARSARADRALAVQRADYRDLVITDHTTGVDLSAFNAVVGADGMTSMLESAAASERVQALLDQQREEYDAAAASAAAAEVAAIDASAAAQDALATARTAREEAEAQAAAATATANRVAARRTAVVRRLARLQGVSVRVAQRRQDALEAEQAAARADTASDPGAAPADDPADDLAADPAPVPQPEPEPAPDPEPATDPAPADGARAAIAYARAQIGEPYRWGAAGPGSWDCSGLTSRAWAAGGRSLPHYSVAQYDVSTPVAASRLRPGDLVFWGDGADPSSIYHVALYAGNGRIIHAPRTGRPVTEESMYYWRAPDLYARP